MKRLDVFLSEKYPQYSRSKIQKWIQEGRVTLGDKTLRKQDLIEGSEDILVDFPKEEKVIAAEQLELDIRYEDEEILLINKPRGMVVHPAPGHRSGTLVNALLARYQNLPYEEKDRPGIVHRMDKDTTGLLLIAKTKHSFDYFKAKFKDHDILREYLALVEGEVPFEKETIHLPLARSRANRLQRTVSPEGKRAVTHVERMTLYDGYTLLRCQLETGRTHQIRAHLKAIGYPVVGDPLYGKKKAKRNADGQLLHAGKLGFHHPITKEWMVFEAELPEDLAHVLSTLREKLWK